LGSELRRDWQVERGYLAFDYWRSHVEFEAFREMYQIECERFAQLLAFERLLEKEVFLGSYYEGDSDNGTDIVPV
jgi:hypothetical protein